MAYFYDRRIYKKHGVQGGNEEGYCNRNEKIKLMNSYNFVSEYKRFFGRHKIIL